MGLFGRFYSKYCPNCLSKNGFWVVYDAKCNNCGWKGSTKELISEKQMIAEKRKIKLKELKNKS